ncbi:MAG: hypothetical protein WDW36_002809 [Sanguina aurantia]
MGNAWSVNRFPSQHSTKEEWATHMAAKWRSARTVELDKLGGLERAPVGRGKSVTAKLELLSESLARQGDLLEKALYAGRGDNHSALHRLQNGIKRGRRIARVDSFSFVIPIALRDDAPRFAAEQRLYIDLKGSLATLEMKFLEPAEDPADASPLSSALVMSPRGVKEKMLPSPYTASPTPLSTSTSFIHRAPFPPPTAVLHGTHASFGSGSASSHALGGSPAPPTHPAPRRTLTTPAYSSPSMLRSTPSSGLTLLQTIEAVRESAAAAAASEVVEGQATKSSATKPRGKSPGAPVMRSASFHQSLPNRKAITSSTANAVAATTAKAAGALLTQHPPALPGGSGGSGAKGSGRPTTSAGKAMTRSPSDGSSGSKKPGPLDLYMSPAPRPGLRTTTSNGSDGSSGSRSTAAAAASLAAARQAVAESDGLLGRGGRDTTSRSEGGAASSSGGGSEGGFPDASGDDGQVVRSHASEPRLRSGGLSAGAGNRSGEGGRAGSARSEMGGRGETPVQVWSESAMANEAWGAGALQPAVAINARRIAALKDIADMRLLTDVGALQGSSKPGAAAARQRSAEANANSRPESGAAQDPAASHVSFETAPKATQQPPAVAGWASRGSSPNFQTPQPAAALGRTESGAPNGIISSSSSSKPPVPRGATLSSIAQLLLPTPSGAKGPVATKAPAGAVESKSNGEIQRVRSGLKSARTVTVPETTIEDEPICISPIVVTAVSRWQMQAKINAETKRLMKSERLLSMYVNRSNAAWVEKQVWGAPPVVSVTEMDAWALSSQGQSQCEEVAKALRKGQVRLVSTPVCAAIGPTWAGLPGYPLARIPARLPARHPARPPAFPPACLPACPPARLPARPPALLPACPPARLPACPPARPPARSPATQFACMCSRPSGSSSRCSNTHGNSSRSSSNNHARAGGGGGSGGSGSVSYRELDLWSTDPWLMLASFGSRIMTQLALAVAAAGGGVDCLDRVVLLLHINASQKAAVVEQLSGKKFHGFPRENIILLVQGHRPGYRYDTVNSTFASDQTCTHTAHNSPPVTPAPTSPHPRALSHAHPPSRPAQLDTRLTSSPPRVPITRKNSSHHSDPGEGLHLSAVAYQPTAPNGIPPAYSRAQSMGVSASLTAAFKAASPYTSASSSPRVLNPASGQLQHAGASLHQRHSLSSATVSEQQQQQQPPPPTQQQHRRSESGMSSIPGLNRSPPPPPLNPLHQLGSGYGLLQLAYAGDGMVVQADGSVAALEGTALELLAKRGVQWLVSRRTRDLVMADPRALFDPVMMGYTLQLRSRQRVSVVTEALQLKDTIAAKQYDNVILQCLPTHAPPPSTPKATGRAAVVNSAFGSSQNYTPPKVRDSLETASSTGSLPPAPEAVAAPEAAAAPAGRTTASPCELRNLELASPNAAVVMREVRDHNLGRVTVGLGRHTFHLPSLAALLAMPGALRPKLHLAHGAIHVIMDVADVTGSANAQSAVLHARSHAPIMTSFEDMDPLMQALVAQECSPEFRRHIIEHTAGKVVQRPPLSAQFKEQPRAAPAEPGVAGPGGAGNACPSSTLHAADVVARGGRVMLVFITQNKVAETAVAAAMAVARPGKDLVLLAHVVQDDLYRVQGANLLQPHYDLLLRNLIDTRADVIMRGSRGLLDCMQEKVEEAEATLVVMGSVAATAGGLSVAAASITLALSKRLAVPILVTTANSRNVAASVLAKQRQQEASPSKTSGLRVLSVVDVPGRGMLHFLCTDVVDTKRGDKLMLAQVSTTSTTTKTNEDSQRRLLAACTSSAVGLNVPVFRQFKLEGAFCSSLVQIIIAGAVHIVGVGLAADSRAPPAAVLQLLASSPAAVLLWRA